MTRFLNEGMVIKRKKLSIIDHTAIVVYELGQEMAVHNAPGKGVTIELLEDFAKNAEVIIAKEYSSSLPGWEIANNARRLVGKKAWSPFYNCQHFVTEALGIKKGSPQLQAFVCVAIFCFLMVKAK